MVFLGGLMMVFKPKRLNTLCILGKNIMIVLLYLPSHYNSVWCDNEFMDGGNILKTNIY